MSLNPEEQLLLARIQLAERLGLPVTARVGALIIPVAEGPSRVAYLADGLNPPRALARPWDRWPLHHIELLGVVGETVPEERHRPYLPLEENLVLELWLGTSHLANGQASCEVAFAASGGQSHVTLQFGKWRLVEDLPEIGRVVQFLETIPRNPGPSPGSGARYPSAEAWRAAIRANVLTRETRFSVSDEAIAGWLSISTTTMYRLMARWGPSTLEELRNGSF